MNVKTPLTQEGYDNLQKELKRLKDVDRIQNLEDIKEARAQGDLSENADYDAARNQQLEIERRIKEIENTLKNSTIISHSTTTNLGKTIKFTILEIRSDEKKQEIIKKIYTKKDEWKLVSSIESDPNNGKLSVESPIGEKLLYAKKGSEEVVKIGDDEIKIKVTDIH